jgi:hypothetical protein
MSPKHSSRRRVVQAAGGVAVAVLGLTGVLAPPASAAPVSGVTMMNRNIHGSISGVVNCPNFNFTSVSSAFVPYGTPYYNPVYKYRWFSCTSATAVVQGELEMAGSYQDVNGQPTVGRAYTLFLFIGRNGSTPSSCGFTTTSSLLAGKVVDRPFSTSWSQLLRSANITGKCNGATANISIDFSEGWSAP